MTKITAVRSCTVRVPLDNPTSFATRQVLAREFALVEIEADDGYTGIGFTYGGNAGGSLVTDAVRTLLAPVLMGKDPARIEDLWNAMYQETILQGRAGSVMRGLSALDIALWDHNARAAGLPLHRFLGSDSDESIRGYASGGYYLEGKTPAMLGDELRGYVDMGFDAVKMKTGRLGVEAEEVRVATAREAIGPDVLLMLDCNNAWHDPETALRYARAFEPYNPHFIEEPFLPEDIENHAALSATTTIPVATGEILAGRWNFRSYLKMQAAAILQPDAICCGGVTEFRRIARSAEEFDVPLYPHAV